MGVRTEIEIRFVFDLTRPLTLVERQALPLLLDKMRILRRQGNANRMGTADIEIAEAALRQLTAAQHTEPMSNGQ